MTAIPYEIAWPNLPHGMMASVSYKEMFETVGQRRGVPLAEAEALYRDLVRHCLWEINPELMMAELRRALKPHESILAHLPAHTHPDFLRVLFDPAHPLHECVVQRKCAVIEQLPQA